MLGPVDLLAGAILGGRGKKVVLAFTFTDNRRALLEASGREWTLIQTERF